MAKKTSPQENPTTQLLSTGKVAELLKVSPNKLKKAIQQLQIEPDAVKCNCNYYSLETIEKIKKAL